MRYLHSYGYIFRNPAGTTNLLYGSLCVIIPVVGPIVWMGYLFEVIEFLHRRREEEKIPEVLLADGAIQSRPTAPAAAPIATSYPNFDFNRFADYLMRGIWPFLVQLVVGLPVGLLIGVLWVVGMIVIGAASANKAGGLVIGVIVVVLLVCYFVAMVLVNWIQVPLYLRAGLRRDFGSAFSVDFAKDFLQRVGREVLQSQLFLLATGIPLALIGTLACYVGLFPAMAFYVMAVHHIDYQLYELYLERGGSPIQAQEGMETTA